MPYVRRLRVSNPHRKRKSRNSRRSRRNPGEVLIVANPKRRRSRNRRSYAKKSHRRSSNPFLGRKRRSFRRHRRGNPSIGGFNTRELLNLALGAGAGVVGSKYAAQMLLGTSNEGAIGY